MPRGDGSVYQLPDGAWRGAYRYRDAAGKPHTLTVRAATKREARRLLDARRAALTTHGQVAHSTMTVGQWLDQWLRETVAPAESPRTTRTYGYAVQSYTAPLHGVRLSALTPAHIERCYAHLRARGYAARTISLTHTVLHRAMADAKRLWLLPHNPASGNAPAVRRRQADDPDAPPLRVYTPAELARLLASAQEAGDRYAPLWWLLASTGLRIGEACGLGWEDVSLGEGAGEGTWVMQESASATPLRGPDSTSLPSIRVRRQLQRNGRELVLRPPKGGKRRVLPIPHAAAVVLAGWREAQQREPRTARAITPGLVFTTPRGGHLESSLAYQQFRRATRRAGLADASPHILRHSYASILIARGVPVTVVSAYLGHASPAITLTVYAHLIAGDLQLAADRIGQVLGDEMVPLLGQSNDPSPYGDGSLLPAWGALGPELCG